MKKWTAFFLALLICLLPVSAVAASPCDNGHTAGSTLHDPTYADCTGGFKSAWYECTVCGQPCGADRTAAVGVSSPQDSGQQPRGAVERGLRVQRRPAPLHNGEKEEIRLIKNLPRPPVRGGFFCCLTATGNTAGRCRTTDPRWACPR